MLRRRDKTVPFDRESGRLEEGARSLDSVREVRCHPEAQPCDRKLNERCLEPSLHDVTHAARGEDVEPRVAHEQRPGNGRGHLGKRRPPRDGESSRGERDPETDVEAAPGDLPVVRDVVPGEREEQKRGPRQQDDRAKQECRSDPRRDQPAAMPPAQGGSRPQLKCAIDTSAYADLRA